MKEYERKVNDGGKKKSEREGVRLASLPAVEEERPGFPLWLFPSLTPPALLPFIQNATQLPVTPCDVPAGQQSTLTHKNLLEQLDLICRHACTQSTFTTRRPAGIEPGFLGLTRYSKTSVRYAHTHIHTHKCTLHLMPGKRRGQQERLISRTEE